MLLDEITPLLLTYNEAPNIGRTLNRLCWARDIVLVDSFSDDETLTIAKQFPQVRVFQQKFDSHGDQWNFGLKKTGISTDWVLALDADYLLTDEFIQELKNLDPAQDIVAYQASFLYCLNGRALRASLYPPVKILFRRTLANYRQEGHTHRLEIQGRILDLVNPIKHDDRKPFRQWFRAQLRYMKLEEEELSHKSFRNLSLADKIRAFRIVAPSAVFFYCWLVKGLILDGFDGLYYSFQRMLSELILSFYLIRNDLSRFLRRVGLRSS